MLHVQGVAVGAVIGTMLPDALLIILPASSPIRQRTSCARLAGSCSSDSLLFSNHLFPQSTMRVTILPSEMDLFEFVRV